MTPAQIIANQTDETLWTIVEDCKKDTSPLSDYAQQSLELASAELINRGWC